MRQSGLKSMASRLACFFACIIARTRAFSTMASSSDDMLQMVPVAKRFAPAAAAPSAPPTSSADLEEACFPEWNEAVRRELGSLSGMMTDFTEAVSISINWEEVEKQGDLSAEVKASLEKLPGRYWKIALVDGRGVFRQELPYDEMGPNNRELFYYFVNDLHEPGWYVSEDLEFNEKTKHVAWSWSSTALWPGTLHVPYWSKRVSPYVTVENHMTWSHTRIGELIDKVKTLQADLAASGPSDEADAPAQDKDAPEHDKPKGKGMGRGWLNKMVIAM
jgi:hypothetical protein